MSETRIRLGKQIEKAPNPLMIPLSNVIGELEYHDVPSLVKTYETVTHLNSVEIVSGNLVIKYTAENGIQQIASTPLTVSQQDIHVQNAQLENPSAGVYRLVITETNGNTYPVDLTALLAVVTKNSQYVNLSGNGTPQKPLQVDFTGDFWELIRKRLDQLDDVKATRELIEEAITDKVVATGMVVLTFDLDGQVWAPKFITSPEALKEVTEVFTNLNSGDFVKLQMDYDFDNRQSVKVFRNGLRLAYGFDYDFESPAEGRRTIFFGTPFDGRSPETVIIDYHPFHQ